MNLSTSDEEIKDSFKNKNSEFSKGVRNIADRNPLEQFKIQSRGGTLAHKIRPGKKLGHEFDSDSARAAALKRWGKA